ncbi:MAG: hypothetical protein ABIK43_00380 [candidate division WOR-3 bacterium]
MRLHTGSNDIRHLPTGVYFVKSNSGRSNPAQNVTRVVVQR